ncbi:MAG: tRNA pseudouridine(38-40) synthase TruA [Opitutus sp.]
MRWKCVCAYDGGPFSGWQSQAGGNAVQDNLEARLAVIFKRQVRVHGSGRTDAGVHAQGQVFHFDADWRHGPDRLLAALRAHLSPAIQLKTLRRVKDTFHARFSAVGKRYQYRIHIGDADPFARPYSWPLFHQLDFTRMQHAAEILSGRHDFRGFTVLNGPPREDTVRDLRRLSVAKRGREIFVQAEADGFLYKMVRSLVGVLVTVGEGRISLERVREILVSGKRTPEVQTAPPQGLFLMKVFYRPVRTVRSQKHERLEAPSLAK